MALKLKTDAATQLISTSDAKTHLRIDHSDEDSYIASLVKAARRMAENHTNRAFITQTWDLWLDEFPTYESLQNDEWWSGVRDGKVSFETNTKRFIELPKPPLQSVTHIKTYDEADTESEYSSSNYFVDTISDPGRVSLNQGQVWPTALRPVNAVNVQFKVGYGDAVTDVPQDIIQSVYIILTHLYENRGDAVVKIPSAALALLSPYRILRI